MNVTEDEAETATEVETTTSTKTMADLRVRVASLLRESLHGKTVDTIDGVMPELPHMLGYTPLGEVHDPHDADGTLLRSGCEWWDDYYKDIRTNKSARHEVETALNTLNEDGLFRVTYPYGDEGGIVYVEVDEPGTTPVSQTESQTIPDGEQYIISCGECDHTFTTAPRLMLYRSYCNINVSVSCPECGCGGTYTRKLLRK